VDHLKAETLVRTEEVTVCADGKHSTSVPCKKGSDPFIRCFIRFLTSFVVEPTNKRTYFQGASDAKGSLDMPMKRLEAAVAKAVAFASNGSRKAGRVSATASGGGSGAKPTPNPRPDTLRSELEAKHAKEMAALVTKHAAELVELNGRIAMEPSAALEKELKNAVFALQS
jgi:hypothetical protein